MYLLHGADLLHTWENTEFPGVWGFLLGFGCLVGWVFFFFNFCVNTPFTYLFLNLLRRMEAKRVMLGGNLHDINKKKNPWKLSGKSMK